MSIKSEKRWIIVGHVGAYVGASLTRRDAIREHVIAYIGGNSSEEERKSKWADCMARGDRAVKATITWDDKQ